MAASRGDAEAAPVNIALASERGDEESDEHGNGEGRRGTAAPLRPVDGVRRYRRACARRAPRPRSRNASSAPRPTSTGEGPSPVNEVAVPPPPVWTPPRGTTWPGLDGHGRARAASAAAADLLGLDRRAVDAAARRGRLRRGGLRGRGLGGRGLRRGRLHGDRGGGDLGGDGRVVLVVAVVVLARERGGAAHRERQQGHAEQEQGAEAGVEGGGHLGLSFRVLPGGVRRRFAAQSTGSPGSAQQDVALRRAQRPIDRRRRSVERQRLLPGAPPASSLERPMLTFLRDLRDVVTGVAPMTPFMAFFAYVWVVWSAKALAARRYRPWLGAGRRPRHDRDRARLQRARGALPPRARQRASRTARPS